MEGGTVVERDILSAAEVAALRTSMGLSQAHLADMLGVNVRTVRSWESGRDKTSPSSSAALWGLLRRHQALTASFLEAGGVVGVSREAEGIPPRGWYLAAAGRAMTVEPDLMVEWV